MRKAITRSGITLALLGLSASGCALRVPHDEVVAAAGVAQGPPAAVGAVPTDEAQPMTPESPVGAASQDAGTGQPNPVTPTTQAPTASPTGAASAAPARASRPATGPARAPNPGKAGSTPTPAPTKPGPAAPTGTGTQTGPATGSEIVLGNVGTYSGVVGALFGDARDAVQVWAAWANSHGGAGGHRVRVLSVDDGGDPSRHLSVVRDLVENRGALAFLGNQVPLTVGASVDYLTKKGIPVVGGDSTTPTWWEQPILYPQTAHVHHAMVGGTKLAVQQGKPKVAIFHCVEASVCKDVFEQNVTRGGAAKVGAEVVYAAQTSLTQPDFTAECTQAKGRGAQTIWLALDGPSSTRVARSCSQQGYRPLYVTGGPGVVSNMTSDPNLDGLVAAGMSFPWIATDTPGAQEYHAAMKAFGSDLADSPTTASVWTAGKLLQRAAANVGVQATSAAIRGGLASIKGDSLGGLAPPLTFNDGRPATVGDPCFFVVGIKSGKWVAPQGSKTTCL